MIKQRMADWFFTGVLLLVVVVSLITVLAQRGNLPDTEAEAIDRWADMWDECGGTYAEIRTDVGTKEFIFSCPKTTGGAFYVKDCQVGNCLEPYTGSRFDLDYDRSANVDYLVGYLEANPPIYDCALMGQVFTDFPEYIIGAPCWNFGQLMFNPQDKGY